MKKVFISKQSEKRSDKMRNAICWGLRKGDMLEKEMPMPIGRFVYMIKERALELSKTKGIVLAHKYYWEIVMERLLLYRRSSECKYGLLLAEKHKPIEFRYNSQNEKEYFFMEEGHQGRAQNQG